MFLGTQSRPTFVARLTASLGVLLVIALAVLASSPDLHERLHAQPAATAHHGAAPDHDEDGCVVTLFAQGIVLALGILALAFTGRTVRAPDYPACERVAPEAPHYLRLPTQAPPLA